MERGRHAAQLQAVCWLIDDSIEHGDAESDFLALSGLCSNLGYDQARFDAMLAEVAAAYREDGGRGLIERSFAEEEPGGSEASSSVDFKPSG